MTKNERIEELEGELSLAKDQAKLWEERCQISWDIRDQAKLAYNDDIESLKADIEMLRSEIKRLEGIEHECADLKKNLEVCKDAYDALLIGMPKVNAKGAGTYELEYELLEHEFQELKEANKLYVTMLQRLLKIISTIEEEMDE